MKATIPQIQAFIKCKGRSYRDRALIRVGILTGASSEELASMTYDKAVPLLKKAGRYDFVVGTLDKYVKAKGLNKNQPLFRSILHGGKLTRTAIWKIIAKAAMRFLGFAGGVSLLQELHARIAKQNKKPVLSRLTKMLGGTDSPRSLLKTESLDAYIDRVTRARPVLA